MVVAQSSPACRRPEFPSSRHRRHTAQIANAVGVAAIGAVFFAIESNQSSRLALLTASALFVLAMIACAAFLTWMRQVTE
jgi:drug/metabolite transporter (DMT)-like permease